MVRSSRIRSTSESSSKSAVSSSNDPASSIFAVATTVATACRSASRNSGWSSAITRRVLAAAVIYFLREGCGKTRDRFGACQASFLLQLSSDRRSHASAQYCQAAKRLIRQNLCVAIDSLPELAGSESSWPTRDSGAEGQKSYWVRFHGDVTVNESLRPSPAHGGDICVNDSGSDSNVHNGGNASQNRRHDEGRTLRHSRFIARHRFRMV